MQPRAPSNLFYILFGHFDENVGGYHLTWGQGKPPKSEGEGGGLVKPSNIINHYFEKYLYSIVLNLTVNL